MAETQQNYGVPIRHKSIARNSRCPCGSGKKYKKCCLLKKKHMMAVAREAVYEEEQKTRANESKD